MSIDSQRAFVVRHSIPGRLRVKVKAILFSKERALVLAHWLSQQSEIDKAEARAVTGSVILDEEAYSKSGGTVACAARHGLIDIISLPL